MQVVLITDSNGYPPKLREKNPTHLKQVSEENMRKYFFFPSIKLS